MDYIEYSVKVYSDGTRRWYLNGRPHREDGPAVEFADGTERWYLNGRVSGINHWYLRGELGGELPRWLRRESLAPTV